MLFIPLSIFALHLSLFALHVSRRKFCLFSITSLSISAPLSTFVFLLLFGLRMERTRETSLGKDRSRFHQCIMKSATKGLDAEQTTRRLEQEEGSNTRRSEGSERHGITDFEMMATWESFGMMILYCARHYRRVVVTSSQIVLFAPALHRSAAQGRRSMKSSVKCWPSTTARGAQSKAMPALPR